MKRFLWKYRKKVLFDRYRPESQLHLAQTMPERAAFPVIDCHTHFGARFAGDTFSGRYESQEVVDRLRAQGVVHCVDLVLFDRDNWERCHRKNAAIDNYISYCAPIDLRGIHDSDYPQKISRAMRAYASQGCVGFKVWKELGLSLKDQEGRRYALNDPIFRPIWDTAAELDLPVVIHVADPPAFFEKADEKNERLEEIVAHPFWHHYYKNISFASLMEQLDSLLDDNPRTVFLIPHLCSWPSNLDYVEALLEKHDNLYVDIAATLSEIGRQPRRFAAFAERFSKRILFGTDFFADGLAQHRKYYQFLETADEHFDYSVDGSLEQGRWKIYGSCLASPLLQRIYHDNAVRLFRLAMPLLEDV